MTRCSLVLAVGLIAGTAPSAHAQAGPEPMSRGYVGAALLYGHPVGPFGQLVEHGFGIMAHGIYRLDPAGWFGVRVDGGFLTYGRETKDVCFSATVGCRIGLELTTSNNIAFGGLGPQVGLPVGRLRPYLAGSIGLAYFATESSVRGDGDQRNFASDTNDDDLTFAWTATGGMYIPVRRGPRPISIDLSVRYHGNGEAEYLTEGDIIDNPDGTITLRQNRSETNLWSIQLGVSLGAGPDRERR